MRSAVGNGGAWERAGRAEELAHAAHAAALQGSEEARATRAMVQGLGRAQLENAVSSRLDLFHAHAARRLWSPAEPAGMEPSPLTAGGATGLVDARPSRLAPGGAATPPTDSECY